MPENAEKVVKRLESKRGSGGPYIKSLFINNGEELVGGNPIRARIVGNSFVNGRNIAISLIDPSRPILNECKRLVSPVTCANVPSDRNFRATKRCSFTSSALYTTPMPPPPNFSTMR